ncbi:hypothetical protein AB4225_18645 [Streptomyces sp. 2RAF24]|uniref:hypothetical protein n=1 Tax=Streptomyces sp. 2RAF24 TaxID=3232997 RepID=UPI003F9729C7
MNGSTLHKAAAERGDGVDTDLVGELVTGSHRLVVSRPPQAERPVDPHTYGSTTRAAR